MGVRVLVTFDDKEVSTECTSLMTKVVFNGSGYIKFPINEPAKGRKKSQIEEYLDFYQSAGVQHLGLATDNIIETVQDLHSRGVEFLQVPADYYQTLTGRVGPTDEDLESLSRLNIPTDIDPEGYLLPLFTRTGEDRPTVRFDTIQPK